MFGRFSTDSSRRVWSGGVTRRREHCAHTVRLARSSPLTQVRPDAPPFFVVQGGHDTFAPGFVEQARHFAGSLPRTATRPVVYAELPGAQHSFDLFHSIAFDAVVDAIEQFTGWVRSCGTTEP
jgi:acetyl esterase/lipase